MLEREASIGARVLVCEDDAIVAEDLQQALAGMGYDVPSPVHTAVDAVETARLERVDVALMDVRLPGGVDGIEAAAALAELRVPVVILTAYSDEPTLARAKQAGSYGYLLKPYDERELRSAIELALYRAEVEGILRESEARHRELFESSPAPAVLLTDEGRVHAANAALASFLGRPAPEDLQGSPLVRFAERPDQASALLRRLHEGEVVRAEEVRFLRGDGGLAVGLVSGRRVTVPGGQGPMLQLLMSDVTEARRLERRLRRSEKMEALGRFAGGVAHDFSNMLTGILGYADLLLADPRLLPDQRADLEELHRAAGRGADLVGRMLSAGRKGMGRPSEMDLSEATASALEAFGASVPPGVEVVADLDPAAGRVRLDPDHMRQILENLLANAREAVGGDGRITLRTRRIDPQEGSGSFAALTVEDTGPGVPPEVLDRIFEPFVTTKPGSAGLGLATVYGVVVGVGGHVEALSAPGGGARFLVHLPRVA